MMNYRTITSRQNPEIIAVAKLHDAKERALHNHYIAQGVRVCKTLLDSSMELVRCYALEKTIPQIEQLITPELIVIVSPEVLAKISTEQTPSGLVCIFRQKTRPDQTHIDAGIVLFDITDPGNMGTLIRTCAAMGKKTVIVVGGVDPWSPKVVQASAGTIGLVNLYQSTWQEIVQISKAKQIPLYALVVSGGSSPEIAPSRCLLVIGNEARGISKEAVNDCHQQITLAMPGAAVESLNAAIAGSIAMYEIWHRTNNS
jgi:RNA methyltransferase, TrmH family